MYLGRSFPWRLKWTGGARLPGGLMSDRDQMQFVQSCGCPGGPCHSPIMRSASPRLLAHCAPARSPGVGANRHPRNASSSTTSNRYCS